MSPISFRLSTGPREGSRTLSNVSRPKKRAGRLPCRAVIELKRDVFVFGMVLAALACTPALATTIVGVDVFSHLQRERIARAGGDETPQAQDTLLNQLLVDPTSPYSTVKGDPAF